MAIDARTRRLLSGNIWKYYVLMMLVGFSMFFNEILLLYYQHFGLSYSQISLVVITQMAVLFLCDVPTGAFADLYGRRMSVMMGVTSMVIALGLLVIASSFAAFLVSAIFFGLAVAFYNGALDALVYDSLKDMGREREYVKVQSRGIGIVICVGMISAFFGPLAYSLSVRLPFYIGFLASLLLFFIPLAMHEPPRKATTKKAAGLHGHYLQIKEGFKTATSHPALLWLIFFSALFAVVDVTLGQLFMAPYIISRGFLVRDLSIVCLISTALQTSFVFMIHAIDKKLGNRRAFYAIILGTLLLLASLALIQSRTYMIGVCFGLLWSVLTFRNVILNNSINRQLAKKNRATVLSVASMTITLMSLPIIPAMGALIDATSLTTGIWALEALAGAGLIALFLLRPKGLGAIIDLRR